MMLREKGNHYAIGSNSLAKCFETVYVCRFCLSPCSKKNSKCTKREPTGSSEDFSYGISKQSFSSNNFAKRSCVFFVVSTVCFPWCRAMAEGLRALCAQCQKPLCGPILASGCNHVCLGIGGTGGTDLATSCGLALIQGSNLQLLLLSTWRGRYN